MLTLTSVCECYDQVIIFNSHEKRWWKREFVAEYMPIVSKNDASLVKLLRRYGLIRVRWDSELNK